jgi:hypothetical protein
MVVVASMGLGRWQPTHHNDVHPDTDQVGRKGREPLGVSLRPAGLQDHGLAIDVAQLAERLQKRILLLPIRRRGRKPEREQTNARDFPQGLRAGCEDRQA